jgi:Lrp/AsnC family transcriptional regulator for asnA, asnC and gidA
LDNQIIQISAILSPSAIGFNVIADVFIQVDPGLVREIAQLLVEREEVSYVACSTGEVDISIQIVANSNESVFEFVTNVIGKIPGVRKTTTSVVPIILKDVYRWRVPNAVIKGKD